MKIVSDTGPLIGLAKIDCLSILKNIATEVLIPPMVHRELLGKVGIESEKIDNALNDFIHITDLKPLDLTTKEALADLDEGEGQAIGLAFTFSEDVSFNQSSTWRAFFVREGSCSDKRDRCNKCLKGSDIVS